MQTPQVTTRDELTHYATARVMERAPSAGVLTVLFIGGGGAGADAVRDAMRSALAGTGRVHFARGALAPGAPVATGEGTHAHTVTAELDTRPDLVVSVVESGGRVWVSAHARTSDPFGGPGPAGWLWIVEGPAQ